MEKVELKNLISQKEELIEKLRVYAENNGGEEFEGEVKNTWQSEEKNINDNNRTYILKNFLIISGVFFFFCLIVYLFSLSVGSGSLNRAFSINIENNSEEKITMFQLIGVSVFFTIIGGIVLFFADAYYCKENHQSFEEYREMRMNYRLRNFSYKFILSKEDLKPLYKTLSDYYGESYQEGNLLFKKMEEIKESEEQVGSYRFLIRLFETAIKEEKEELNSRKVLGSQVRAIIEE